MINNINNIILTQFYPIVKSISKWIFSFYDIAIFVYLSKTIRKDKIKLKIRIITIENLSIFVDKIQSKYTNAANFTPNIKINDLNSSNASILQNQIVNSIYPYPYSSIWQRSHRKLVYFRSRGIYPHQKKKKTFINHKINILPHMYVIFHDLKNNLQLVSPHFFLSVKKKQNLFAFSRIDFLRSFTLSLSLESLLHSLHRHCVHTRVHRERLREISIRIAITRGWRSKSVWSQKIGGETPG